MVYLRQGLHHIDRWLQKLESVRPFTEGEAWWLFRAAALAEAVGWTLLIIAVAARYFGWSWQSYAIPIAGRIHGTFFIAYFLVNLAIYTSLRWPRWQFGLGVLAGIPPYGSLIFEQLAARYRRRTAIRTLIRLVWYFKLASPKSEAYTNANNE